ncbi:site-specific integrase [Limosilactobacillus fermentum]|uniref:site-specific integrase n=1 Tax=Limosilactobacillus fermentum TaxID=1613 RepID=UPI001BFFE84F|nr:site-specific integrase [Limosilactobacillus fermentum]
MASYVKRSGKWQARISWYDTAGKRRFKNKGGFATKSLAKKWAVENEANLAKGILTDKEITFADYVDQWVMTYKEPKVAKISLDRYHYTANEVRRFFKLTPIRQVTRTMYQEFINDYGSCHAPSTVKKVNSYIRSAVKSAILDDYLIKDFTQGVELNSDNSRSIKVDYLNKAEIHRLIQHAEAGLTHRYTSRHMIVTAIYTGMRLAEIQALTWSDIDWIKSTITINKSWDAHTRQFKPTKTESSNRVIKVNRHLLALLRGLRTHSKSNMVFLTQFGTIPTSNAVNKTLRTLLADLGINRQNFHFHSLRHSHVALLLASGIDLYAISKRLGHSSTVITSNTYAYLIDEYKAQTDELIIAALESI